MRTPWNVGRRTLYTCLVLLAVAYWGLTAARAYERRTYLQVAQRTPRLLLLNGAKLDLTDRGVVELVGGAPPTSERLLLLAISDVCPGVREMMPYWRQLLHDVPGDGSVGVSVLSVSGRNVADEFGAILKARGVPHEVLLGAPSNLFPLRTGIASTPYAIILDHERRVRRAAAGVDLFAFQDVDKDFRRCLQQGQC